MNRVMAAKYAGTCGPCGQRFAAGTVINYGGTGRVSHEACGPAAVAAVTPARKYRRSYSDRQWNDMYDTNNGAYRNYSASCGCEDYPCCGH